MTINVSTDFKSVIAVKNDGQDIKGVWFGTTFVWPDPWVDIWDEGPRIIWDNVWRNEWSIPFVAAPPEQKELTDGN